MTAQVTGSGGKTPTGSVSFRRAFSVLGRAPIDANGVATFTFTIGAISANFNGFYNGDSNFAGAGSDIIPVSTSGPTPKAAALSLTSLLNPSAPGQNPTFVASLDPPDATGTVTIASEGFYCSEAVVNGRMTCTGAFGSTGDYFVTASYSGDAIYRSVRAVNLFQSVVSTASSLVLSASPTSAQPNQPVTLTATVSPVDATGTVTFTDGATVLCNAVSVSNGVAACATAFATEATHALTATYSGGANVGAATGSLSLFVGAKQVSASALASSPNPSLRGQPVTLTARVTPATATGTVTFKQGDTVLCASVAVASGKANCATSFAAAGSFALTAVFSGDAVLFGSTSAALTHTVNDQTQQTVQTIGRFMAQRAQQIVANGFDGGRQIDRLTEAGDGEGGDGATGSGFASASPRAMAAPAASLPAGAMLPVGGGAMESSPFANSRSERGVNGFLAGLMRDQYGALRSEDSSTLNGALAGLRIQASNESAMRLGFGTSLREMRRSAEESERRKISDAGLSFTDATKSSRRRPDPFDFWVEGRYAGFRDNRSAADVDGHFGILSAGFDYVLDRNLLAGVFVQFDTMASRSASRSTEARGQGWLAGPYATLRLTQNVFLQARAGWGQASNEVSPFLTYTDSFDSDRWTASATLAGRWAYGPWSFRPSASVMYFEETSHGYTDTLGMAMPEVKSRIGQMKAGPEAGYRVKSVPGLPGVVIEPRAGMQAIWTFTEETTAAGLGTITTEQTGPAGVRGRAEIGLRASSGDGYSLDLSGSYDGIGSPDYNALSGRANLRIPLN